ncbi:MAG TPA: potassium transporter TrkG [Spirochaetia bacterium]|nr:potassium transporter TrkG [Spirochaetia bacterium]
MRLRISSEKLFIFSYFIGIILAGACLLMLPAAWRGPAPLRFIDALFTSTSAVCVTGLITVDTALYTRLGQSVIALLIQFGGLGIITFATIYVTLPRKRISLVNRGIIKQYYIEEIEYNPKLIIKHILVSTLAIETLGAALLYPRFRGEPQAVFTSAFHAVSAFCNAGFSTFPDSLESRVSDPVVNLVVMSLIVAGGIGFTTLRDIGKRATGSKRRLSTQTKVVLSTTAVLLLGGAAVYYVLEAGHAYRGMPPGERLMAAAFQSVTPRTAGFDTVPQSRLSDASVLVTMILMFIGASPGSTGGGVKTTTLFIVVLAALRGVDEKSRLAVGRRAIPTTTILKAFSIIGKAVLLVVASATALLAMERHAVVSGDLGLVEVLFESISAFGTVGLSLGITARLSAAGKLVLVLTMFAGRVGLFAMALPKPRGSLERYVDLPSTDMMTG